MPTGVGMKSDNNGKSAGRYFERKILLKQPGVIKMVSGPP
jgi:hypothetical protein